MAVTVNLRNDFLKHFSRIWAKLNSGLLIFDWLKSLDIFTPSPCSASSSHKKIVSGKNSVIYYFSSYIDSIDHCKIKSSGKSDSPSIAAPCARYTISNAFNARSTSSIIRVEDALEYTVLLLTIP